MQTNASRLRRTLALLLAGIASTGLTAPTPDYNYPPAVTLAQVRERLNTAPPPHPRLLTSQAELASVRQTSQPDPLRRQLADTVIRQAELMLKAPPITRTLEGRRLLGQSRACVQRVITLALAFHLTDDSRYVRRAEQEMLSAARFQDWNPTHFLDVAEMTFALAIGYDWLHAQLADAARNEIAAAIIQKGVSLPFATRHNGWVKSSNNWGQVCHGGLTAGALAVMELDPDLAARTVHNALSNVTYSMTAFAPKGSYPEGPGYWAYGTGYNVLLIGVLESAMGTDFGLSHAPGFDQTGQYPNLVGGPSGAFFNYADGGSGRGPEPFLFWFAARFGRPDWLLGERERLRTALTAMARNPSASRGDRFLPLTLLWLKDQPEPTDIRMPLHWSSEGETPITVHRSSWTDPRATFVGFKGGSPSANHGQMDIGSFVLDADGVRWALDLGAEGYHGIEARGMNLWNRAQNSDRWTIFRQSNLGHNTLVIDDQLQQAAASGKFVRFSTDAAFPHSVIEMSDVYAGQAASVHRGIALLPSGEVLIQDQLTGLTPGSRIRWGMITPGEPGEAIGAVVHLHRQDTRLTLSILAPRQAAWRAIDTATPKNEWDSPNPGTRMLAFEMTAPASSELTLAVLATPGSCRNSLKSSLPLRPLLDWGN
ncbi:MAG: heparinase II/III family protein [Verrucomicrobia bacterium]|nr:heparinase II/III family protein [Verrucomicrobiota bacterium]